MDFIGELTLSEIKPSHIYELLRPIWVEIVDRCARLMSPGRQAEMRANGSRSGKAHRYRYYTCSAKARQVTPAQPR